MEFEKVEVPSVEELKSTRINHWANLIITTKVDAAAEGILSHLHGQFAHLTKEDLLMRLITTQLDHLQIQGGAEVDLNETSSHVDRKSNSGFHRYFINIGSIDGLTKADLIHYVSDTSGINRKYFKDLSLQKNCAFFDVDNTYDKGLIDSFKGLEIAGREIRVNRDDEGKKEQGLQ